jgi:uncharacterized membrane protein
MTKDRLEAFSDGVFSISITLLVLDIKLPATVGSNQELISSIRQVAPNIMAFVFSFLVVGVFWVAHHRIFHFIRKADHIILWSNIFYLMSVAFIPFPTSILAAHPFLPTAILLYSLVLLLCGSQHFWLLRFIYKHPEYKEEELTRRAYKESMWLASVGPVCYALAAAFSFVNPAISFVFIILALLFYIVIVYYILRKTKLWSKAPKGKTGPNELVG